MHDAINKLHVLEGPRKLYAVSCDEPGLTKFTFSYIAHVTLLTPAQARLRIGSGLAQAYSGLLSLRTISGRLRRSIHNYFNSSRASPELVPYIKMANAFAQVVAVSIVILLTLFRY